MPANYPATVYAPRTKENKNGVVYEATKKTVLFAEDVSKLDDEVVAIETELGATPKQTSASVAERLKGFKSEADATADMVVVKGGNVGIGVVVPTSKLHLDAGSNPTGTPLLFLRGVSAGGNLNNTVHNDSNSLNSRCGFEFRIGDTSLGAASQFAKGFFQAVLTDITAGLAGTELRFRNTQAGVDTLAIVVDKFGNVGIGTATPSGRLDIYGMAAIDGSAPVTFRIGDLQSSSSWTVDALFAALDFFSSDASGQGSAVRARIGCVHELNTGGESGLAFFTKISGSLTEKIRLNAYGKFGIGTKTPTALLDVASDILRLRTAKTPASAAAAGNAGDICWDANYIYVCVSTNTWKRSAIATW